MTERQSLYSESHWVARAKALRNVPLILGLMWQVAPALFLGAMLARVLGALVPLGVLALSKLIVDEIVASQGIPLTQNGELIELVAAEFALAVAAVLLVRFISYCDALLAERFTLHVSITVMGHSATLDQSSFENPAFYDKLERARQQATDRFGMIRAIGDLVQNLTVALSLAVGVAAYSPWYVAVLVFCTIPIFIADSYFSLRWYSLKLSQTPVKRELDYLRQLATHRDSSKELRLFNLGDFLIRRYAQKSRKILNDDRKLQGRKLLGGSLAAVTTGGQYAIYVVLLSQAVLGVITLGTLLFVAGAVAGAARAIQEIFVAFSGIADQALFVTDLRVFLAEKPVVTANANARSVPRPLRQGFELRNVSFTYPRSERRVLDRVSFRIRPGERVALVGENGQGKTTVVKLLLRLYDPTEGQVLLDGIDLREYSIAELHAAAGVIFQDFVRYEMTVAENIGVGRVSGMNDERRLRQAAKWSGAEEIIERLPQGLHQKLGRRFYGGIDISGGEWQRIALARAYMRDAQFFILDEPTASLDAKAEREVFDHFADLTRGKMALLISHRFSTVKTADRILVLSGGKIIEDDDHQGLMARGGLYSRLFTLQAENFR